jgi:uncharacterized phage infection (PIP) family protein YhgE
MREAAAKAVDAAEALNATAEEIASEIAALRAQATDATADLSAKQNEVNARISTEEEVQDALKRAIAVLRPHPELASTVGLLETLAEQSAKAAASAWADFADAEGKMREAAAKAVDAAEASEAHSADIELRRADAATAVADLNAQIAAMETEEGHLATFEGAVKGKCEALLEQFGERSEARKSTLRNFDTARAAIENA